MGDSQSQFVSKTTNNAISDSLKLFLQVHFVKTYLFYPVLQVHSSSATVTVMQIGSEIFSQTIFIEHNYHSCKIIREVKNRVEGNIAQRCLEAKVANFSTGL